MTKSRLPVRQDPSTMIGANVNTGQMTLGDEAAGLPTVPTLVPSLVVAKIKALNEQADRVLAGAERATVTTESASTSADFLVSITKRIGEVDEERKSVTGGFDKLVKGLNALFTTGPTAKLSKARTIMLGKLTVFRAEEQARLDREAEAERQRIAAEAAAQAETALEEGDSSGALEILESAATAATFVEPEKASVRGRGGSVLSPTRRKVGKVTNLRAFIAWVGSDPSSMALAAAGGISVGQKELNQLAATILAANELAKKTGADPLVIPGFEAEYAESLSARG